MLSAFNGTQEITTHNRIDGLMQGMLKGVESIRLSNFYLRGSYHVQRANFLLTPFVLPAFYWSKFWMEMD
ncbi:MAG: hypothetical protein IPJ20_22835 [Flammeovirgaceae bacterium]|nr:hypothetical protein [Flammeovirgaceae bacterium]